MRTARERDGRAPGGAGGGGSGRRAAPARPRACTTEPTIGLPSPDRQQKHSNSSRSEERRTQRGFPSAHRASSIEQRSQAQLPSPSAEASTGRAPFAQRTPFFGPKQLRPAHDHTTPSLAHSPNDHRTTNYLPALPGDDEPQRAIERRQKVKVHAIAAKRRKLPSAEIRKASVKSATAQCDDFQTFQVSIFAFFPHTHTRHLSPFEKTRKKFAVNSS